MEQRSGRNRPGKYLNKKSAAFPVAEAEADALETVLKETEVSNSRIKRIRGSQHIVKLPSKDQIQEERTNLERKKAFRQALSSTVSVLLVVAALAVLIATLFLPVLQISGTSMEPTLYNGDIIVLFKTGSYDRGDLCSFAYENKYLIKRIIGIFQCTHLFITEYLIPDFSATYQCPYQTPPHPRTSHHHPVR